MNISELVLANRIPQEPCPSFMKQSDMRKSHPLRLANGMRLWVQASKEHACSPKCNEGPWNTFEVGIDADIMPLIPKSWEDYADYYLDSDMEFNVISSIPGEMVAALIDALGGLWKPKLVEIKVQPYRATQPKVYVHNTHGIVIVNGKFYVLPTNRIVPGAELFVGNSDECNNEYFNLTRGNK